jgi:2-C-methyl-D-erythritol 4-phosphate cytidylyltransferase
MVEWSIAAFRACDSVGSIVVACPPGQLSGPGEGAARDGGAGALDRLRVEIVEGGAARSESVRNALAAVETELVAIHDAARPLVTPGLIDGVVATLSADPGAAGAIAATPVTDTIKRVPERTSAAFPIAGEENAALVEETLDRTVLWAAQTPQVFRVETLRAALDAAAAEALVAATDEAMLVEAAGGRVLIHASPPENLKVTTPLDMRLAELLLGERAG